MCEINITDLSNNKIFFSSECKVYQQKTPILSFAEGCDWKVSFKIHLEKLNLEPDLYIIRCKQDDDNIFYIPFVLLNTDKKKDIAARVYVMQLKDSSVGWGNTGAKILKIISGLGVRKFRLVWLFV